MVQKLKFKNHFSAQRLEPDIVFLLSEQKGNVVLKGRIYYLLAPLLNGSHTISDIAGKLQGKAALLEIHYAVTRLMNKGYVVKVQNELPVDLETLCHSLDVGIDAAQARWANTKVFVASTNSIPTDPLVKILQANHIQVSGQEANADLLVVLTADYLQPELEIFNQAFLERRQAWMLIKPVGTTFWLGPTFQPNQSGCWNCLVQRLKIHRRLESLFQLDDNIRPLLPSLNSFPAAPEAILNLSATEIIKWVLLGENRVLAENIVTLDTITLKTEKHVFVKRPQCPCCGDPSLVANRMQQPIVLKSQRAFFTMDSGHRTLSADETVARLEHHISKITGIVETLQRKDTNNLGIINTYSSGLNVNYQAKSYRGLYSLLQNQDLGKGITTSQAKASALCEAIERYSSSFQGDEYRIKASYLELGARAIHPNECMRFSEEQYLHADEWNNQSRRMAFNCVPPRFDETAEIEWTPVWSLTWNEFKYLPTDYCYYRYTGEHLSSTPACSNGNAAGNSLEEAILHGFIELAERDCASVWWYNRVERPAVDLASFGDSYIERLQVYYNSINRDLWVLDITSDLNIPAFVALSRRQGTKREDIIFGFGTCLDPRIGILKALTELNQSLGLFLSVEDGELPQGNKEAAQWWQTATIENQPYLSPKQGSKPKTYSDYPRQWSDDIKDDVMLCARIAKQHNLETLVLDLTQPDIGLNVVKIIVPGLRHFWRRLGPGRLYDVPVELGWLDKPLPENEMNSFSIFI